MLGKKEKKLNEKLGGNEWYITPWDLVRIAGAMLQLFAIGCPNAPCKGHLRKMCLKWKDCGYIPVVLRSIQDEREGGSTRGYKRLCVKVIQLQIIPSVHEYNKS